MSTILLVEDSAFLRMSNERLLVKDGYRVISAADGEEALLMATDHLPDLIILDMLLPKVSGPDVLQSLKASSKTKNIPVIVLSGLSRKNEEKLRQEGACLFLEKEPLIQAPQLLCEAITHSLALRN